MKRFIFLFLLAITSSLSAQEEEIFQVVEQMPRFPGCEEAGLAKAELQQCAQRKMLEFVYSNIQYPVIAREEGTEGTVVIRFVVDIDGSVQEAKIVRDIGSECGTEALRVVELMNEKGVKWIPGMQEGKPVKVYFSLPVKYKLESNEDREAPEQLPYFMVDTDTVFTQYHEAPIYGTEEDALQELLESLSYPKGVDSCVAGSMVMQLFINKVGGVRIGDIFDYSNLGFDFQFEAIQLMNSSNKKWKAAKRNGRSVNCFVPLRIVFKPKGENCQEAAAGFDKAYSLAADAEKNYAEGKVSEAVALWSEALTLMPNNTEFLLLRGQAYLELNDKAAACADLQQAKQSVPLAEWVAQTLPYLCQMAEEDAAPMPEEEK